MIEQTIFETLKGLANDRVYPLLMPQNPTLPAVVYTRVGNTPQYTLDCPATLDQHLFQFDAYAETYLEAVTLADQVRTALEQSSMKGTLQTSLDFYENAPGGLDRVSNDFYLWGRRE